MKSCTKKAVAASLASAMVLSMAGCSFLDKSKDEVLEAADSYAKSMADCSVDKLAKLTVSDFEDDQEEWAAKLDFSEGELYTADAAAALSAIADTISYEIDEDSAEASKKSGEGSVDVTFTIADYSSLLEDESLTDVNDFVDAVGDADTVEISVSLEFEKDDEDWLCSNYSKAFDSLYAFADEEYVFTLPLTDCLDSENLEWWFTDNGDDTAPVYTNATQISAELPLDESLDYDLTGVRAELTFGGSVVCTSEDSYDLWAKADEVDVSFLDATGTYFAAGTYTITYYDANDNIILSGSATVAVEDTATATTTAASGSMAADVGYVDYRTQQGDAFYDGTSVPWWYGSTDDSGAYTSGVSALEFDIKRNDDTLGEVTYEYYYSATGSYDDAALLGTYTCEVTTYQNGDFYECKYEGSIADGYYVIIVSYDGVQQEASVCSVGM